LDLTQVEVFGFPGLRGNIDFVEKEVGVLEGFDRVFVRETEVSRVFDEVEVVAA